MKNTEFICTKCPMGCMLTLTINGDDIKVSGNSCKIGEKYGITEYTNPVRIITTSLRLNTKDGLKMISVKTNDDVPKSMLDECLREIKKVDLKKENIKIGDVIIPNLLGLNVDVVATRASR
ncbi:MAG: DUF1667 domain-containing protein [Lachnospirales bacterium]